MRAFIIFWTFILIFPWGLGLSILTLDYLISQGIDVEGFLLICRTIIYIGLMIHMLQRIYNRCEETIFEDLNKI